MRPLAETADMELKEKIDRLLDSVNDSARVCRAQVAALLLVVLYLGITLLSTNDEALLRGGNVNLPQLNAGLSLRQSYLWAPLVFVFLHVGLLIQLDLLAAKLRGFNRMLEHLGSEEARDYYRLLLAPFTFNQALAGPREAGIARWLTGVLTWLSIAVIPLGLVLGAQVSFVRYHDGWITLLHQILVTADLFVLGLFLWRFRRGAAASTAKTRVRLWAGRTALAVGVLLVLKVSWFDATLPDESYENAEQRGLPNLVDWECGHQIGPCRHLDVSGRLLVAQRPGLEIVAQYRSSGKRADQAIRDLSEGLNLISRDLRFAMLQNSLFFGANLSGARLYGADLSKAELFNAQLQGADLRYADLRRSDLQYAQLQGAKLSGARLHGADLYNALYTEDTTFPDGFDPIKAGMKLDAR